MNELKDSLKKMGWNDNLIDHYVGKEIQAVCRSSKSIFSSQLRDTKNLVISANGQTSNKILIKNV